MRRREFVGVLGAHWPLAVRAQRPPAMPVAGMLIFRMRETVRAHHV
jgi:hypothetical protein